MIGFLLLCAAILGLGLLLLVWNLALWGITVALWRFWQRWAIDDLDKSSEYVVSPDLPAHRRPLWQPRDDG